MTSEHEENRGPPSPSAVLLDVSWNLSCLACRAARAPRKTTLRMRMMTMTMSRGMKVRLLSLHFLAWKRWQVTVLH